MTSTSKEYPPLAEIRKSPAFHTAIWDLVPHQSGLLPVAKDRGGVLKVAWEVHGEGPIKVLLLCGLGLTKASYQRQTLHFGHSHGGKYSVLLIENRGVGGSDKPWRRWYSTSEMARDAVEVLNHLGWGTSGGSDSSKREVHVMGISMGGMIAQELALLIPDRIASLGLVSTSSAFAVDSSTTTIAATAAAEDQQATLATAKSPDDDASTTNAKDEKPKVSLYEALTERFAFMIPKSTEQSIQYFATRIYSPEWVHAPDDAALPDHATPRCNMPPSHVNGGQYGRFQTNYERCAAQDVLRREMPPYSEQFSRFGFWAQMFGAGTHRKTKEQLQELADKVGRERIWIVHGDRDAMIDVSHGRRLVDAIQPAYWSIEKGLGHGPIVERTAWFNGLLAERCQVGEALSGR
ncbi:Alpha/Beta hydrolase protein [Microdochium trichocladiopsis]|uniref:Alpha/Beta hydrolase protein n=1 Tax=Microdochium trichocladiopsis TaxID=1682393 RepID=A0A9P8XWP6_9PEZI|nr:Alpha/Beta hydrolase protein [Microdochium trichocladiopsis]KAH7018379.1 Alpha/Beta hydrolase protein [Microdochium trichocladiopsis]